MGERKRSHGENDNEDGNEDDSEEEEEEEPNKPSAKKSRTSVSAATAAATNRNKPKTARRRRTDNKNESQSSPLPHRVPTNTQTDIQKIIRALSEYARGTNNSYNNTATTGGARTTCIPSELEPIPRVLVGLIGSHCEVDPGGVAEAARGIVEFCGCGNSNNNSGWLSLRFVRNRETILRNEFRSVFSSGGIETVLSALQRIVPRVYAPTSTATYPNYNTNNHTSVDASAKKEAIYHCWGVVKAGVIAGGLSKTTLLNVVHGCLFALNHEIDPEDTDTSTSTGTGQPNAKILWAVLGVLSETLAVPGLTARDLFYPHRDRATSRPCDAVFAACLSKLAKACSCGTTHRSGLVRAVIGETLGVFVACARKGLIAGSDYERLVPACRASLARYEMELAESTTNANANTNTTNNNNIILVRIVELMEAEDRTVGLWLRHTYGIPPLTSRHQQEAQEPPPPPPRESTRRGDGGVPPLPNDNGSSPRMAAPVPSWPSVLVAEPDDDETSDEDEDDDDDEEE